MSECGPLREDGLSAVAHALSELVADPQRLERERERFVNPPPGWHLESPLPTTMVRSPCLPPTGGDHWPAERGYRPHREMSRSYQQFLSQISEMERRFVSERRVARERECEASQAYHQFMCQISKERERIQDQDANSGEFLSDANTTAYGNVKNRWVKRGIGDPRWGTLPGMTWKHEEPGEDLPRPFHNGDV